MKRCQKSSLHDLERRGRSQVLLTFPSWKKTPTTTSLVLKSPKTESSIRKVFLPKTVALALQEARRTQDERKRLIGSEYAGYDLVIAHDDGRPYPENHLTPVVFHSLRQCSASLKLQIGGNIKPTYT